MKNLTLRQYLITKNVKHWELAERLGISAGTLCVRLRKELPEDVVREMCALVDEIAEGR